MIAPLKQQPAAMEHIRQYLAKSLKQATEAASNAPPDAPPPPALLAPLKVRLTQLLEKVPDEAKRQGLSVATLQTYLAGRRQQFCHTGELAAALRGIGWTCRRDQSRRAIREGRAGHLWYPPANGRQSTS